jgi:hypothetical protein
LNASGIALNPTVAGCFINPIGGADLKIGVGNLYYNTTSKELQYSTTNSAITYSTNLVTIDASMNVIGNYISTNGNITLTNGTITAAAFSGAVTNTNNILLTADNTAGT